MANAGHVGRGKLWYNWPGPGCGARHQLSPTAFSPDGPYDVAIVGAGVIGCALAYELSQHQLRVIMLDRGFDVGEGASKGNSAIIHTGFDATPDSLESQLVTSASRAWPELAQKLKVPFRTVSALMVALDDEQAARLPEIRAGALANGVDDVELLTADDARRLEPNISPLARGGLLVPRESIIDPFTTCVAYAAVAGENGVDIALGLQVLRIDDACRDVKFVVAEGGFRIPARWIVNASGLGARRLVETYGGERMDLNPRRGEFLVYDRACSSLVHRILLPIPTKHTKGMLVAPTIFGNLLAGPTAEDLPPDSADAARTTHAGLAAVRASVEALCPALVGRPVIATYAGVRCNCSQGSYWMRFNDGHPNIVTLAGIRSTGLTSSITTARHVIRRMNVECGLALVRNPAAVDSRSESTWPGWYRPPFRDRARLVVQPDYGRIVCSCENISRGEIQDALASCPGVATLDGVKRRTRALTGRCQGFNCGVPIAQMVCAHYQVPLSAVTKSGPGSEFVARQLAPPRFVPCQPTSRPLLLRPSYRVAVVGAGPAGIGVAVSLARAGVAPVLLVDRAGDIGGIPAFYTVNTNGIPTFVVWTRGRVLFGEQFVALLRVRLKQTNTDVCLESQVVAVDTPTKMLRMVRPGDGLVEVRAESIVFACGARERSGAERGWFAGARPARQFFTMQLLQLIDGGDALPAERAAIIGSDVIAYSAGAKLVAAGGTCPAMLDTGPHPQTRFWERLYFRRWYRPNAFLATGHASVIGERSAVAVEAGHLRRECDGIVFSGELIPNSELVEAAGFAVSHPDRVPAVSNRGELDAPGWFIAGAETGGLHGAYWCYRHGLRIGGRVAAHLRRTSDRVSS